MKALEELTQADLELPVEEAKPVIPHKPVEQPTPVKHMEVHRPGRYTPGPLFVSLIQFEDIFRSVRVAQEHLNFLQSHNEKLGMIEMHTKNHLDQLLTTFEQAQRSLLSMDEKLFKVN